MKVKRKVTVTLSKEEVSNVLKKYVRDTMKLDASDVRFNMREKSTGYGVGETFTIELDDIDVICETIESA